MPRFAAVDIGSNSVRMLAAEITNGLPMRVLAEDRQVTRIGQSVFAGGVISEETIALVVDVLARMRASYEQHDVAAVRAVATSAVRDARNQADFLRRAEAALGTRVETISGLEEARLIHMGVAAALPAAPRCALLIDIGGGSAEFILSENGEMRGAFSKPLGAVRLWQDFLSGDPPSQEQLHSMEAYIAEKMREALDAFGGQPLEVAIGTSSSASAAVCAVNRIPRSRRAEADGLRASAGDLAILYRRLSPMTLSERRDVVGIGPRRAEIIVPGVAVLKMALESFGISNLLFSSAGVRDGIVLDLAARGAGRERVTMVQEQRLAVERVTHRFGQDLIRARQVAAFAVELFIALESLHRLPHWFGRVLEAAAHLHDVGHLISATRHHKHSHYMVSNADLPGFTEQEQRLIAVLCRYHRKSMPTASHPEFTSLSDDERRALLHLIPLLRLADAFDRSRGQPVHTLACRVSQDGVTLQLQHDGPVDLERWAAQRCAAPFADVYRKSLQLEFVPSDSSSPGD